MLLDGVKNQQALSVSTFPACAVIIGIPLLLLGRLCTGTLLQHEEIQTMSGILVMGALLFPLRTMSGLLS